MVLRLALPTLIAAAVAVCGPADLLAQRGDQSGRDSSRRSTPLSGQEAYNTLRRTFSKLGYVDYRGRSGEPIRYETQVKSFSEQKCMLVMEESKRYSPSFTYAERIVEVTYIDLAELDADEIRSTDEQMDDFPAGSWFVTVPAKGPALRVQFAKLFGDQVAKQGEVKPDRVHFFLSRYDAMAEDVARSLQVLARACGAR